MVGRVRGENAGQYWSGRCLISAFLKFSHVWGIWSSTFPGFSPEASLLNKGENIESEKQGQFSSISRTCVLLNSETEV